MMRFSFKESFKDRLICRLLIGMMGCLSLSLFSCNDKNETPSPEAGGAVKKLTFHVKGFEQEINPLTTAKVSAAANDVDYIQTLEYRSFDEDGKTVTHFEQDNTYDNFGTISDELTTGTYNVVIYGARSTGKKVPFSPEPNDIRETTFNTGFYYPSKTSSNGLDEWYAKECFAYRAKIVIGEEDQNIDVSLARVSSIIELQLLDNTIPDNVSRIKISFDPAPTVYKPFPSDTTSWAEDVNKVVGNITYEVSDRSRKNFWAYPTPANGAELPCKVYIQAFDANNNSIAFKEINEVVVKRNMKTVLSGYLFDGTSGKSYTIGIDPEWKGVQQEIEF